MSKSYRYCVTCEKQTQFSFTDGDRGDVKSRGWFCITCDWKLDERKVRHIEKKIDLEHDLENIKKDIRELISKKNEIMRLLK